MTPPTSTPTSPPVLGPDSIAGRWADEIDAARGVDADDLAAVLPWIARIGRAAPDPGTGRTRDLWELVAGIAEVDVALARMLEPHLDARAVLTQARAEVPEIAARLGEVDADEDSTWGVFAAESPGMRLEARAASDGWTLSGRKPWCSLAGVLTHALVTAWVSPTERGLFAVDLRSAGVDAQPGPWFARGLPHVVSAPVDFDLTRAVPIGPAGWYLTRPGFAWGGMGVAAIWWGAALPLAAAITGAARRPGADQLAESYAGRADAEVWAARAVLADAAQRIDAGLPGADAKILAARTRDVVANAVERVLSLADHALGPGPLTVDDSHARRVADLHLYLRQHHAERDAARLGRLVVGR